MNSKKHYSTSVTALAATLLLAGCLGGGGGGGSGGDSTAVSSATSSGSVNSRDLADSNQLTASGQALTVTLPGDGQGQWRNYRLDNSTDRDRAQNGNASVTLNGGSAELRDNVLYFTPVPGFSGQLVIPYRVDVSAHPQHGSKTLSGRVVLSVVASAEQNGQYVKLGADGKPLANQHAKYDTQPWPCVFDTQSQAVWSVASKDANHPLYAKNRYKWGNGNYGSASNGQNLCNAKDGQCDTDALLEKINSQQLCGYGDWRLPNYEELRGLIRKERYNADNKTPAIDADVFPDTVWQATDTPEFDAQEYAYYWSGTTAPSDPALANSYDDGVEQGVFPRMNAMTQAFGRGFFTLSADRYRDHAFKGAAHFVRLVRGGTPVRAEVPVYKPEIASRETELASKLITGAGGTSDGTDWRCIEDKRYPDRPRTLWLTTDKNKTFTHDQARNFAQRLSAARACGIANWRLPTHAELAMTVSQQYGTRAHQLAWRTIFSDLGSERRYWSASPTAFAYRTWRGIDMKDSGVQEIASYNANLSLRARFIAVDDSGWQPKTPETTFLPGTAILGPEEVARDDSKAFRRLKTGADSRVSEVADSLVFDERNQWDCVEDLRYGRGQYWLVRKRGSGGGVLNRGETFTWGDTASDPHKPANCSLTGSCTVNNAIKAVNAIKVCGRTNWRLPTLAELLTLTVGQPHLPFGSGSNPLNVTTGYYRTFGDLDVSDHQGERFWTTTRKCSMYPNFLPDVDGSCRPEFSKDSEIWTIQFNSSLANPYPVKSNQALGLRLIADRP